MLIGYAGVVSGVTVFCRPCGFHCHRRGTMKDFEMNNRNLHIWEIASLRDAVWGLIYSPQTALCLSGVIKIKPL